MPKTEKRKFGDVGEKIAEDFLVKSGYKILDKNYRIRNLGEIDIVGEKNGKWVFVEVKTRDISHETSFPIGFSINNKKRKNLKRICQLYLIDKNCPQNQEWQVDAIFINVNRETGEQNIEHLENILWEQYY